MLFRRLWNVVPLALEHCFAGFGRVVLKPSVANWTVSWATFWNTGITAKRKSQGLRPCDFLYCNGAFLSCSNARQSWSGHDVFLAPQRIPLMRCMTSSMCCPRTSWLIPCRLPLQPPRKNTCCMMLFSSAVTSMSFEQVPRVSYCMCFVFICLAVLSN